MVSGNSDLKRIFYLSWFHQFPDWLRIFGESFLPPLIIILINQILLYIIYILGRDQVIKLIWKAIIDTLYIKVVFW